MRDLVTKDYPCYNEVNNLFFTDKSESSFKNRDDPIIYTDGSKMENGVGAAYTVFYNGNFMTIR